MNKSWLTLIVIAIIVVLLIAGYDFYLSLTGENSSFDKQVTEISGDLGKETLDNIKANAVNIPIKNQELDNK